MQEFTADFILDDEQIERLKQIQQKINKNPKVKEPFTLEKTFAFIMRSGAKYVINDRLDFFETYVNYDDN